MFKNLVNRNVLDGQKNYKWPIVLVREFAAQFLYDYVAKKTSSNTEKHDMLLTDVIHVARHMVKHVLMIIHLLNPITQT